LGERAGKTQFGWKRTKVHGCREFRVTLEVSEASLKVFSAAMGGEKEIELYTENQQHAEPKGLMDNKR